MWTAAFWGLIAGAALLVGAGLVMVRPVRLRVIGAVMGFGAGVLFAAVAFELTAEALDGAGSGVVVALVAGALVYVAGDWAVSNAGAYRRKSPLHGGTGVSQHHRLVALHHAAVVASPVSTQAPAPEPEPGSASSPTGGSAPATAAGALVLGALLDGIPESVAIGISLIDGGGVGVAFVAAVFLSNVPEGLAASAGLLQADRSRRSILGLWTLVAVVSALAAGLGFAVLGTAGPAVLGGIQAFAAGAVLAMLATTMLPEAVDHAGRLVGVVTVLGFVAAVLLGEL